VNKGAERSDGRNITVRNITLPLVYLVTVVGIVGLVRKRRRRGAELLILEGAYFTVVSVAVIAVPRLRAPLDLAAAIGVGLLVAEVISRRAPEAREPAPAASATVEAPTAPRWSRRARILVTLATVVGVVVAAGASRSRGTGSRRTRSRSWSRSSFATGGPCNASPPSTPTAS
jgi:uncharacterized membrane protein YgcG